MRHFTVTLTMRNGYVFNNRMPAAELRTFLANAAAVLQPGETLTYVEVV